jgi:hypothetical protein
MPKQIGRMKRVLQVSLNGNEIYLAMVQKKVEFPISGR